MRVACEDDSARLQSSRLDSRRDLTPGASQAEAAADLRSALKLIASRSSKADASTRRDLCTLVPRKEETAGNSQSARLPSRVCDDQLRLHSPPNMLFGLALFAPRVR